MVPRTSQRGCAKLRAFREVALQSMKTVFSTPQPCPYLSLYSAFQSVVPKSGLLRLIWDVA